MSLKITNTSVTYQDVVDSTPQLTASGTGKLVASAVVSAPLTASANWAIPLTVGGTQVQAPPGAKFLGGYVSDLAFTPGSITTALLIGTPATITTPTTTPTSASTIMSSTDSTVGTLVADTTSPSTFGLLATVTVSTTQNSTIPVTSSPYLSLQIVDSVALPVGTATVVLYYQL